MQNSDIRVSFSQLAFRVSTAAARAHATVDQVVKLLRESRRFGWIALQVLTEDEPDRWEFAWPPEDDSEVHLRAESRTSLVSVAIDAAVPAVHSDEARLVLEFVVQQLAQFLHRRELHAQNGRLAAEARITNEQVSLGKFMDRAKSLIVARRGLSASEAEEWLLGASIRYQKPLLNVAQEIVTALTTPGLAA